MTINIGDKLPDSTFTVMGPEGPLAKATAEIFAGKKVALFAVPGAYTPTCDKQHLPGFLERYDELKGSGVDTIACTAVNDIFVLDHWAKEHAAESKILMLSDGSAEFAKKIGLEIDLASRGFGIRSKRYAMVVEDGVVKILNVEDLPPHHDKSSAATLCTLLRPMK